MIETLHGAETHAYLGGLLGENVTNQNAVEPTHHIRVAWERFCVHRQTLQNKHVSIRNRMGLFGIVVSPAVLYRFSSMALTGKQLLDLDRVQRRMLRSIVGWRRSADEEWSDTMRRIAMHQHFVPTGHNISNDINSYWCQNWTQPGWTARCVNWKPSQD